MRYTANRQIGIFCYKNPFCFWNVYLEDSQITEIQCTRIRDPKVVPTINRIFVLASRKINATLEFI